MKGADLPSAQDLVGGDPDLAGVEAKRQGGGDFLVLLGHNPALGDPAVHSVPGPVLIGEPSKSTRAPRGSPGVLDNETAAVIPHDDEGVATVIGGGRLQGDGPIVALGWRRFGVLHPTVVTDRARVQNANLIECHVHICHGACVHAVVCAERAGCGVLPPVLRGVRGCGRHVKGFPQIQSAHPVFEPALHSAAKAGTGVPGRARDVVIAAGHGVDHEWRHLWDLCAVRRMLPEEQVDHASQCKACAGGRFTLIQDW